MAKATFQELVNRTIRECGISGAGVPSVVGQIGILLKVVNWVADADIYIQRVYRDWNFLHNTGTFNTIANTRDYVKPVTLSMWDPTSFYLGYGTNTGTPLNTVEYEHWRNVLGVGAQVLSLPSNIVIRPNKDLIVYPTPDNVYQIQYDYWALPTRLVANTDTSLIPEQYEDVIVHRAKVLYAQHEEAGDMLQSAQAEYEASLAALTSNEAPHMDAIANANVNATIQVI